MTILAPHFCTQQTVTLKRHQSVQISKSFGLQPVTRGGGGCPAWHFWSGQIIYFHNVLGRKIYFPVNRRKKKKKGEV